MTKALAARLREFVDGTRGPYTGLPNDIRAILTALEGVEEMREALTPFTYLSDPLNECDDLGVTVHVYGHDERDLVLTLGTFRRARAALKEKP